MNAKVNIRLSATEKPILVALAKKQKCTLTSFLRQLLRQAIKYEVIMARAKSQDAQNAKTSTVFHNFYEHADCPKQPGIQWEDDADSECNDRCPACNAEITPYKSTLPDDEEK